MKKFNYYIEKLKQENQYSFYLSFCRVFVAILLLKKLFVQWSLVQLIYAGKGFVIPTNTTLNEFVFNFNSSIIRDNIYIFLAIFIFFIIFLLFGIGRNFTAFVVFIMYDLLQKLCPQILNGGDNFLRFIIMYLVFADSFSYFVIEKNKPNKKYSLSNFFSNLAGLSICIHFCLIYFVSAIHKIHSDVWFNGIATYYTLNIERFRGSSINQSLANNSLFTTVSTYGTWLIELLYPILVWFSQFKNIMVCSAILLHLSIAILMMLYDFQLIFIMVQGFFYSNNFWISKYQVALSKTKKVFKTFNLSI